MSLAYAFTSVNSIFTVPLFPPQCTSLFEAVGKDGGYIVYKSRAQFVNLGNGQYQLVGDVNTIIDEQILSKAARGSWKVRTTFDEINKLPIYETHSGLISGFARELSLGLAIDLVIETPFFINEVVYDPYLTTRQKVFQGGIEVLGIGAAAATGTYVGTAVGGIPGAILGGVVGLGVGILYDYIAKPIWQAAFIYATGTDPYDGKRLLAPLN